MGHPQHGLIPPSVFIPLLERHKLINNLSATLLIQAFAAVRELPANFGLSVNLATQQLHDRTLPNLIEIMADEAEFDLRRLTEILRLKFVDLKFKGNKGVEPAVEEEQVERKSRPPTCTGNSEPTKQKSRPSSSRNSFIRLSSPRCRSLSATASA